MLRYGLNPVIFLINNGGALGWGGGGGRALCEEAGGGVVVWLGCHINISCDSTAGGRGRGHMVGWGIMLGRR